MPFFRDLIITQQYLNINGFYYIKRNYTNFFDYYFCHYSTCLLIRCFFFSYNESQVAPFFLCIFPKTFLYLFLVIYLSLLISFPFFFVLEILGIYYVGKFFRGLRKKNMFLSGTSALFISGIGVFYRIG